MDKQKLQILLYPSSEENLVTNGTFEDDLTGWDTLNWVINDDGANTTYGFSGKYASRNGYWDNYIKQDCLTVGKTYKISWNAAGAFKNNYTVSVGTSQRVMTTKGYNEIEVTCVGNTYISFSANRGEGLQIDNVEVYEVGIEEELDLYEGEEINLTFSIAEIEDLSKRQGGSSLNFTLPGSKNNNDVFTHLWNINSDGDFKFHNSVKARIYEETLPIFEGFMELTKVMINDDEIQYEVVFYQEIIDLFSKIGEKTFLDNEDSNYDLDFSEYTHTIEYDNIVSSWENWSGGTGYYYGLYDIGRNTTDVRIDDLKPSLFHKEIFDKILDKYEYTYTSDFLDGDMFKKFVYPPTSPVYQTDAEINDYTLSAYRYTSEPKSYTTMCNAQYYDEVYEEMKMYKGEELQETLVYPTVFGSYTGPTSNPNFLYWNTTLQRYTVQSKGKYNVSFNVEQTTKYSKDFYIGDEAFSSRYFLNLIGETEISNFTSDEVINYFPRAIFTLYVIRNGQKFALYQKQVSPEPISSDVNPGSSQYLHEYTFLNGIGIEISTEDVNYSEDVDLLIDDIITSEITIVGTQYFYFKELAKNNEKVFLTTNIKRQNLIINPIKSIKAEHEILDPTSILHSKTKQKDYLQSIIKMFNLYIDVDKNKPNNLLIEPRDDYYSGSTYLDWTTKLDTESEITIEYPNELLYKNIKMSYKESNDFFNTAYQNGTNRIWGEYQSIYDNSTELSAKMRRLDEKEYGLEINTIFAGTPLSSLGAGTYTNRIIVPQLTTLSDGVVDKTIETPIRFLFSGGNITTNGNYWALKSYQPNNFPINVTYTIKTEYPYMGHLDNPLDDTYDLNWWYNQWYWWNTSDGSINPNNLFYTYYYNQLNELLDSKARKVTCYMNLNNVDIANLDFRKRIFIKDTYYRLLKVDNYKPNSLTKVELLKIVVNEPITLSNKSIKVVKPVLPSPDTNDSGDNNEISKEVIDGRVIGDDNIVEKSIYINITGDNNYIMYGGDTITIIGDYNTTEQYTKDITILNSNNVTIKENVKNVFVDNTSNITVNESNVSIVNGMLIRDGVQFPYNPLIDGGRDENQNYFSAIPQEYISNGRDCNRQRNSTIPINYISGGKDNV